MRIMIGADTYPPDVNGAARFAERLAIGLAGRGHEVHVVAPSPEGPAGSREVEGVTVHRIRSHRYPLQDSFRVCLPWQARPGTAAVLGEVAPDVVHVQAHFSVGRGVAVAAAEAGLPLVATNHFMPENLLDHSFLPSALHGPASRFAWRDLRNVFRRADAVTAPTPRAVELLERSTGLTGSAISCGIDADRYAGGTEDATPTILFVGRLDQEKRVDELIRAVATLPPGLRLEIVGDGSKRAEWTALVDRLGIADRVVFHGFVDEADLVAAYRRCAVFCMPGVAELQSLVTLEAMAAGKPVVAADAMALPHLVRPGRNGWLYPPGDIDTLAASLGALLRDRGTRARMGATSREIVAGHALATTLDAFEAVYTRVLAPVGTRLTAAA
jgi:phosphatidylinositol alpha 1,6-mannosyltransferase